MGALQRNEGLSHRQTSGIEGKVKGILFKPEMNLAIREDRKTQTRRLVKIREWDGDDPLWSDRNGDIHELIDAARYRVGEVVYLKEGWFPDPPIDGTWDNYSFDDGALFNFDVLPKRFKTSKHVLYRVGWDGIDLRWRSAMFMPEWAARTFLEITAVRVERLQDISEEDAKAEGCVSIFERIENMSQEQTFTSGGRMYDRPFAASYACLWDEINDEVATWKSNPFTFAYTFKRVQR